MGQIFTITGSVFPRAAAVAFVPASLTMLVRLILNFADVQMTQEVLPLTLYNTFTAVLGFVVVFRTSIAYSRYWDGINSLRTMAAQWYDAAAGVTAFAETSGRPKEEAKAFQVTICRLMYLMHCFALQEVADLENEDFDILDVEGLNESLIATLSQIASPRTKVEKVFQWVQISILNAINTGMIQTPAPIVSRSFAQLNAGMIAFERMATISQVPFPFPYVQMIGCLLAIHSLMTPLLIGTWGDSSEAGPGMATCAFAFFQVFALASLNLTAQEIEQPFGSDPNDLDIVGAQHDMNHSLETLLEAHTQALMTYRPSGIKADGSPQTSKTRWSLVQQMVLSGDAVARLGGEGQVDAKSAQERPRTLTSVQERSNEVVTQGHPKQSQMVSPRMETLSSLPIASAAERQVEYAGDRLHVWEATSNRGRTSTKKYLGDRSLEISNPVQHRGPLQVEPARLGNTPQFVHSVNDTSHSSSQPPLFPTMVHATDLTLEFPGNTPAVHSMPSQELQGIGPSGSQNSSCMPQCMSPAPTHIDEGDVQNVVL